MIPLKEKNGAPQNWFFSASMSLHLFEWFLCHMDKGYFGHILVPCYNAKNSLK